MINDKPINSNIKPVVVSAAPAPARPQSKEQDSAVSEEVKAKNQELKLEATSSSSAEQVPENKPLSIAESLAEAQKEEVKEKVNEAIPKVRELLQKNQRSLDFKVAEQENRVIITVIDKETDKVIRQIPPEDFLQIAQSINEGLETVNGGLFQSKV